MARGLGMAWAGAAAVLALSLAPDAFAQRGGGRGGAPAARQIERPIARPSDQWRRSLPERDIDTLRARTRAACAADSSTDVCDGGGSLRRRLWNACHGDAPPTVCRRVFGDDDQNAHLRRRIWNACHGEDAPPAFCRRIFGQDPSSPHLRRRIWNACHDGDAPPAFCRRIFGEA